MHGGGKSDEAIVAVKPANAAEQSAAELVEPRAEAKGNAARQSTYRTQRRVDVSQRRTAYATALAVCRLDPRWEPYAGKPHVRFCAGGAQQWASLPRPIRRSGAKADACPRSWRAGTSLRSFARPTSFSNGACGFCSIHTPAPDQLACSSPVRRPVKECQKMSNLVVLGFDGIHT